MKMFALIALLAVPVTARAVLAPYTDDFNGTDAADSFPAETGTWVVSGGTYNNTMASGTNTTTAASTAITNLDGVSWTMSTQFTVVSAAAAASNSSFTLGFGAFASSSSFSNSGSNSYYLADFAFKASGTPTPSLGTLRILNLGASSDFTSVSTGSAIASGSETNYAVVLGTTYTLKLDGVFSAGVLTMTLGLYDSTGTTQIGSSAISSDSTPIDGDNFGYRNRTSGNTSTSTEIAFDNFSVAIVPEPGMAIPIATALVSLAIFLRRRHASA